MPIEANCAKVAVWKNSRCLACGSKVTVELQHVFDTRFGIEGNFNMCQCGSCGLRQLSPSPSSNELKRLYETYYNFGGSKKSLYTKFRRTFLESVFYRLWMAIDGDICFHSKRGNGRLLDIGCNEGQGLQIYKQNGFMAEGLELNDRAASETRKRGFRVYADSLETFQPEQSYDVVVLSHVLEHSLNPREMLTHVARILKPDGQVWISCPNIKSWQRDVFGRYWINWHVPFHTTFFSAATLKCLLNDSGFEVIKAKYATPSLWLAQSVIASLFAKQGRKNYAQRSPILLGSLMLLARCIFSPFLWLGNFSGRGDCLAIEARKKTN